MIKRLIEDLENIVSDRLQQSTKEYWNIKDFLTRLEQVDLEEVQEALDYLTDEISGLDYFGNGRKDIQQLIDVLKGEE